MKIYIILLFAFSNALAQVKHLDSTHTYSFLSPRDSIITEKSIYSYDANKKLRLILQDTFDVTKNKLYVNSKTEYQYDADGNQTLFLFSLWRQPRNEWYVKKKIENSFENDKINQLELYFDIYNDSLFMNSQEFKMTYRNDKKTLETWALNYSLKYNTFGYYILFSYNNTGKIVSQVLLNWDNTTNTWKDTSKREYLYDNSDKLIEVVNYTRNSFNTIWMNNYKIAYSYNNKSNLIQEISSVWNTTFNIWQGQYKTESTFNEKNKEVTRIYYTAGSVKVVGDVNNWNNSYKNKEEYSYDEIGNLTSLTSYFWGQTSTINITQWIMSYKWEYTYNSNKKITSFVSYSRNNVNAPVPNNKTEYIYDINGNLTFRLNASWDSKNSEWKNVSKYEQNLDVEGRTLLSAFYNWNNNLNIWQGVGDKIENSFDERGETSNKLYSWNLTSNSWQKIMQKYFYYEKDLSNNAHLSELNLSEGTLNAAFNSDVFTYRVNNLFKVPNIIAIPAHKNAMVKIETPKNILSDNEEDRTATIKVTAEDGKTTLTYYLIFSKLITGTEGNETQIQVYPNPSSNKIVINTESVFPFSIRIINMEGTVLEQIKDIRDKQTELSVENYTKGTYIVEVSDGFKLLFRKKMIFQ